VKRSRRKYRPVTGRRSQAVPMACFGATLIARPAIAGGLGGVRSAARHNRNVFEIFVIRFSKCG